MQDKIEPTPYHSSNLSKEGSKPLTTPYLFEQVQKWLAVQSKADLLLESLSFLEMLSEETMQKKALPKKEFFLPDDHITKTLKGKFDNVNEVQKTLTEFKSALESHDKNAMVRSFEKFSDQLFAVDDESYPVGFKHHLKEEAAQTKLGALAFEIFLSKVAVASLQEGVSDSDIQKKLQHIKKNVSGFKEAAVSNVQNAASQLQELRGLVGAVDPKEIETLLASLKSETQAPSQYRAYLREKLTIHSANLALASTETMVRTLLQTLIQVASTLPKNSQIVKKLREYEGHLPRPTQGATDSVNMAIDELFETFKYESLPLETKHALIDKLQKTTIELQQYCQEESQALTDKQLKLASELKKNPSETLEEEVSGYRGATHTLDHIAKNFSQAATDLKAKRIISGQGDPSLPDQFVNIILEKFMPYEEAQLMGVANLVNFLNFASMGCSQILMSMSDFSSASANYSFAQWMKQNPNATASQIRAHVQSEISQANADMSNINQALSKIGDEINSIKNNTKMTASQKAGLLSQLQGYANNLEAAFTNLHQLSADLSNDPPIVSTIQKDENAIVSGGPPSLPGIQSQISNDQLQYQGLGQQQQTALQMLMANVQQEWTLVSSCMQSLNTAYMTFCQAVAR